ncbi:hypothetical protein E1H99_09290 [Enterococcus hirae]|nr:hypothetical protein E1H99_09290 [Enterococcus hirae]
MKKIILFISSCLFLTCLLAFGSFFLFPVKDVTSKAIMDQPAETKMEYVPTKKELLKSMDEQLLFLGIYQVTEINFNKDPYIILTKDEKNELSFEIDILDIKEQRFSIPGLKFSPQNLHIADTFGIARKDNQYFAYKSNSYSEFTPNPTS